LGNFLFHLFRDDGYIFRLGLWDAIIAFHSYAIFALVLSVAIGLSQLRALAHKRRSPAGARKWLSIAGVLTFYCLMTVFDNSSRSQTIVDYSSYFLSLFWP
jgi:hypothetical protein